LTDKNIYDKVLASQQQNVKVNRQYESLSNYITWFALGDVLVFFERRSGLHLVCDAVTIVKTASHFLIYVKSIA
jgi:hypothetical protein